MADEIKLDLDPSKVLAAVNDLKKQFQELASVVERELGKKAAGNVREFEQVAQNGASKITEHFRNLATRVKEDLKTAFDATGIMAGTKFTKDLAEGVRQIFSMEQAYDRLNTRLKMTTQGMNEFKTALNRRVANTGQDVQNILPGVETVASKGGVTNATHLADIGEALAKAKATSGEDPAHLADTVVDIIKNQGGTVTSGSFKKTLDALEGGRVSGAFDNAQEIGSNVQELAKYTTNMTARELAGLSATASKGGSSGTDILRQLMHVATLPGGEANLNGILGQNIIKNGRLDPAAIGRIDPKILGDYSAQSLEGATRIQGHNGADFTRFIAAFKENMGAYKEVVTGANETADQFEVASDNFATKFNRFRENLKRSTGEVGEELSQSANELLKGNLAAAVSHVGGAAGKVSDNAGSLSAGLALTVGSGMLLGGGLNRLLGRVGGNALGSAVAGMAGVQQVFVTNASDMSSGMESLVGVGGPLTLAIAAGVVTGFGAMHLADYLTGGKYSQVVSKPAEWIYNWTHQDELQPSTPAPVGANDQVAASGQNSYDVEALAQAVYQGQKRFSSEDDTKPDYLNKSAVEGTGRNMSK